MKTDIKEINSYTRELTITVPWEELKDDFDEEIRNFSKKVKLPGFRPGKAPKKVIMNQYLPSIEADFIEGAFQSAYIKALNEHDLSPVSQAQVKDLDFHYEQDLHFTAEFEIDPEIQLPTLKKNSLSVSKTKYKSDDEDVRLTIEEMQYSRADVRPVEDGAKAGQFILGDLQELDQSGMPVIGNKLEKRYLKIGEGIFTGENEKKLTGLKPGDTARIDIPDDKENIIPFELSVTRVEEQVLPEIDLDLVKQVDPGFESLDEWKASVKERIDKNYEQRAQEQYDRNLADALIEKVNPEFPPSMVHAYLDHLVEDLKKSNNGEPLDEEKVRETYHAVAERNLKWYLIRNAIIKQEGFEVTEEETKAKIEEIIEQSPEDQIKQIEKYYKKPSNRNRIEDDLMEAKILNFIEQFAKVKEVVVKTSDLRKMGESEHNHEH